MKEGRKGYLKDRHKEKSSILLPFLVTIPDCFSSLPAISILSTSLIVPLSAVTSMS
jgi:hypothetical protein